MTARRIRSLLPLLACLLAPAPGAGSQEAPSADDPRDVDAAPKRVITSEDVKRWTPVDPRALRSPLPEFRRLAELVDQGTTDPRILRAYWRLSVRLYPYEEAPPRDLVPRALEARDALAKRSAGPPPDAGCWFPMGPRTIPGRMTAIALHPTEPDTVYTVGADGGVWRTTDLGQTWIPLTDFEATLSMGALAIDPVDPRILYAGTGEGNYSSDCYPGLGVLKTTDAGATWTLLPMPATEFHQLLVDPRDRTRLWAATVSGLFVSRDAAQTWAPAGGGLPAADTNSVIVSAKPGSSVMLAGVGPGFGSVAASGIWRSTDGGASWTRVTSFPQGGDNGRLVLVQSPADPDRIYASVGRTGNGRHKGVWRSDDEGATWTQALDCPATNPPQGVCRVCSTYCWYELTIAADAGDRDVVYLGGLPIYRSQDGGQRWTRASLTGPNDYVHVDLHHMFSPAPDVLWAASDGGIYVTRDRGLNWDFVGYSLETAQYYHIETDPTDDTYATGGTQDNGTHRFSGNTSWVEIFGGDGAFTAISSKDPRIWYGSAQYLYLGRSRSRGDGMQALFPGPPNPPWNADRIAFIAPFALDRSNPDSLLAGSHRLWRSLDQGTSFSAASGDLTRGSGVILSIDSCRDVAGAWWVGTNDGKVWYTPDGGANWNDRSAGLPNRAITSISVHPSIPETAYLTVSGTGAGHVWKTTDAGRTWRDVSTGLPDLSFNRVLVLEDLPRSLVAAADVGVYRSDDEGASWRVYGTELPNAAVDWLAYSPLTGTLRAGTHGRGAWQLAAPSSCILYPEFAGVTSAGVLGCTPLLAWEPARSNCPLAPGLSYNVYRSTDPLFTPGPATLLQAGLTGLGYTDSSALPGVAYYYIVRAEDGQTGFGGPANGGKEDANLKAHRITVGDPVAGGSFADDGGDGAAWLRSDASWSVAANGNVTPGGRYSYQNVSPGAVAYSSWTCSALETPDLLIGTGATLAYQASYNLEEEWDGVKVQVSTNGGQSWTDLPPAGGYPGTLAQTQGSACNWPAAETCFTGPPGNGAPTGFRPYTSSLAGLAGQVARFRWLANSDYALEYEGFLLDAVRISPVSTPPRPALPALGNVLRVVRQTGASHFTWQDGTGIPGYRLSHSLAPDMSGRTELGVAVSGTTGIVDTELGSEPVRYHRVQALGECGSEGPI